MSVKQKTTQSLGFSAVLWHYRLSGRKDIRLIKIHWLFQSPMWEYRLSWVYPEKGP